MKLLLSKSIPVLSLITLLFFFFTVSDVFAGQTAGTDAGAGDGTANPDGLMSLLWSFVLNVFGFIMGAGGLLLNETFSAFVAGFGNGFNNLNAVIHTLWSAVRDLFNLTFIFGLVYIGFKMILDSENSQTRKWLVHLILAALLINFSLYITQVVVDVSNLLATEIAQTFVREVDGEDKMAISEAFMNLMGIQTTINQPDQSLAKGNATYTYIFGSAIIFLIAGFVFGAGGVLLSIRYAMLVLFMILSPMMFLGWVLPGLQSYSSKYWTAFLGRAFFAPVYILFLYFSAEVLRVVYGSRTVDFSETFSASGKVVSDSFASSIMPFVLSAIFLIASLVISMKMGADGAKGAVGMMQKARQSVQKQVQRTARRGVQVAGATAGGATAGLAARGLRNTLGKKANSFVESDKGKRMAAKGFVGKQLYKASKGVAGSSFDARQVGGAGKALGIGEGVKGGYSKKVRDRVESDKKFAEELGIEEIRDAETGKIKEEFAQQIATDINDDKKVNDASAGVKTEKNELVSSKDKKMDADAALEAKKKIVADKKKPLQEQLATLRTDFNSETDQDKKDSIQKKMEQIRLQESDVDREFEKDINDLTKESATAQTVVKETEKKVAEAEKKLKKAFTEASARAEATATYGRQIAYMKQLENTAKLWNNPTAIVGGAIGGSVLGQTIGATAGVSSAGVGAVGAMGLATAASARGNETDISRKNLEKIWGRDGLKKAKKDKQKKDFEIWEEVRKESVDKNDEGTKTDDTNNDTTT